jgi:predicted secreted protein
LAARICRKARQRVEATEAAAEARMKKAFHSNLAIKIRVMLPQKGEIDVISAF